ncbi:MAG: SEC-C domain-containing protein [Kurthia sp.]|nr:SEC-C domain-containing protein [Candidatus Kurthia equi]
MIGRNDPCPCGSGKKYKKCHGKNAEGNIQQLVNDELNRLERSFIQEVNPASNYKMNQSYQKLSEELSTVFPDFLINAINIETSVYIEDAAHWQQFITHQVETTMRTQVKEVIENWLNPRFILAHVESTDETYINLLDEVNGQTYKILNTADGSTPGEWIFGIAMPDSRHGENGLIVKSSSLFIPKNDEATKTALLEKLKAGVTDAYELYKIFVAATPVTESEATEVAETETTSEAKKEEAVKAPAKSETKVEAATSYNDEVIALAKKYLSEYNLNADAFLTNLQDFLTTEDVKAKKPETLAASAILAGQAIEAIPEGGLSKVKDVAEYYEVSASSLSKYRKQITEFLEK